MKERIHIAVPTLGGVLANELHQFLALCAMNNHVGECPWMFSWEITDSKRPVHYARNLLCAAVLKDPDISRMFFIDADMVPPGAETFKLLEVDADIAVGTTYKFDHANEHKPASVKLTSYNYEESRHAFVPIIPDMDEMITALQGSGTACMVIKRHVLEDPRMHLRQEYRGLDGKIHNVIHEDQRPEWAPCIFRTMEMPNGEILRGEDLDFCRRANTLGYTIKGHLGVRFGHRKTIDLGNVLDIVNRVSTEVLDDQRRGIDFGNKDRIGLRTGGGRVVCQSK